VGEADRAISRLDHLLTIPHGPAPLTQALLRLARGTEMMMPLWMRLFQGVIGHPHFNWQIVRSQ
jgi:hypothetical protein